MKRLNPFSPFSWKINIFWTAWLACVYVFMRNHKQVKQNAPNPVFSHGEVPRKQ